MKQHFWFYVMCFGLSLGLSSAARAQGPIEVEPSELANRRDLIGKEIVVDDRVRIFFPTKNGTFNKIYLKRTNVVLLLPSEFQYTTPQSQKAVRARGILRQDESGLFVDVNARPELFIDDIKRLKNVVAAFPPNDAESRMSWGDWASRRAKAFADSDLKAMAQTLHSEAVAIELRDPRTRSPEAILALARKARAKGVDEPEPSALAHLAFRLRLTSGSTAAEFEKLADEISAFLPQSRSSANVDPSLRAEAYLKDPAGVYRKDEAARAVLDRRLWTDAVAESFRLRAKSENSQGLMELANEAQSRLPDRREISGDLRRRAYEAAASDITSLRENEMLNLVKTYREDLNKPKEAEAMLRAWLDAKIKKLSPTNAEDRTIYAEKYFSLLKDKRAAADLLNAALTIDPDSAPAVNLYQRMGFLKVNGVWQEPNGATASAPEAGGDRPIPREDALLGLTPSEVKAQLGEPKRISRIVTQGGTSIQWVYEGARGAQYIDFLHRSGDAHPSVVGHYSSR